MERFRLTIGYSFALIVLMIAAGWIQTQGQSVDPAAVQSVSAEPVAQQGGGRSELARPLLIALLFPTSLIALVLLCESNPVWAGKLLRARFWAPFVLSFPYFFLLVLLSGIAVQFVLVSPLAQLFIPLEAFAAANAFLLWGLFFSLVAVFSLPALERWVLKRYP